MNPLWAERFREMWEKKLDPKDIVVVADVDLSLLPKERNDDPDFVSFTWGGA